MSWEERIREYKHKATGRTWCIVRIEDDQPYLVVPIQEVLHVNHVIIQDLTREEALMWRKMMG